MLGAGGGGEDRAERSRLPALEEGSESQVLEDRSPLESSSWSGCSTSGLVLTLLAPPGG